MNTQYHTETFLSVLNQQMLQKKEFTSRKKTVSPLNSKPLILRQNGLSLLLIRGNQCCENGRQTRETIRKKLSLNTACRCYSAHFKWVQKKKLIWKLVACWFSHSKSGITLAGLYKESVESCIMWTLLVSSGSWVISSSLSCKNF